MDSLLPCPSVLQFRCLCSMANYWETWEVALQAFLLPKQAHKPKHLLEDPLLLQLERENHARQGCSNSLEPTVSSRESCPEHLSIQPHTMDKWSRIQILCSMVRDTFYLFCNHINNIYVHNITYYTNLQDLLHSYPNQSLQFLTVQKNLEGGIISRSLCCMQSLKVNQGRLRCRPWWDLPQSYTDGFGRYLDFKFKFGCQPILQLIQFLLKQQIQLSQDMFPYRNKKIVRRQLSHLWFLGEGVERGIKVFVLQWFSFEKKCDLKCDVLGFSQNIHP